MAKRQVEEYALLLHYFYKASAGRQIVPIIASAEFRGDSNALERRESFLQMSSYWVTPVIQSSWQGLSDPLVAQSSGRNEDSFEQKINVGA